MRAAWSQREDLWLVRDWEFWRLVPQWKQVSKVQDKDRESWWLYAYEVSYLQSRLLLCVRTLSKEHLSLFPIRWACLSNDWWLLFQEKEMLLYLSLGPNWDLPSLMCDSLWSTLSRGHGVGPTLGDLWKVSLSQKWTASTHQSWQNGQSALMLKGCWGDNHQVDLYHCLRGTCMFTWSPSWMSTDTKPQSCLIVPCYIIYFIVLVRLRIYWARTNAK